MRVAVLVVSFGLASLAHADIGGPEPECPPNRILEFDHGHASCRRPMCNDQSDCFAGQHCPVHRCARRVEDTACFEELGLTPPSRRNAPATMQAEGTQALDDLSMDTSMSGVTEADRSESAMQSTMEGAMQSAMQGENPRGRTPAQKPGPEMLIVAEPPPPCPDRLEHIDQECDRCNDCPGYTFCAPVRCVDGPLPAAITPCPANYTPRAPRPPAADETPTDCSATGSGAGWLGAAVALLLARRRTRR